MKTSIIVNVFAAIALAAAQQASAQSVPVVTVPTANADLAVSDWQDLQSFLRQDGPRQGMTRRQYFEWMAKRAPEVQDRLRSFYAAHPTSPLRWNAVMRMQDYPPPFISAYGPDFEKKGLADATIDTVAKAAFEAKLAEYTHALETATDVPKDVRSQFVGRQLLRDVSGAANGPGADWPALHARTVSYIKDYPDSNLSLNIVLEYMYGFEGADPAHAAAEWAAFVPLPNPGVSAMASDKVKAFALLKDPLEMTFSSADGRPVDLQRLRGKVVLVDFWATWCGPCKEEIPNVTRIYSAYHDKGFEVVGISLENSRVMPTDTPEKAEAKLAAAKKVLLDFTANAGMTWPQYFDGKFWKNDIAKKYAINAIPAMFLLDQDGRVVSTNARGPKLESEVKRLLKL